MNSAQIERNLKKMMENFSKESFVFELLRAYGTPKATVTLLQKGRRNLSKEDHQVILKKKLFFHECQDEDLHVEIDDLQKDKKTMSHSPRFIVATNYKTILAVDTKTQETLDIPLNELAKNYAFFLPWAGIEKHKHKNENPADRKAAEKMAKLYDGILAENKVYERGRTHDLNIFLSRLLFCFFAEDTGIFEDGIFTGSVGSHTQVDGSDLHEYLDKLFDTLNIKEEERQGLPAYLEKFPYVNGGLFAKKHWIPKFSAKSRRIIMECAELDWAEINPDIFGSMIQAVAHPGKRGSLGMHYTSVPNIMKVVEPLFLNDLREEFEKYENNPKKLGELKDRLSKIKFFDPACGSGNFLIITYKEIRKLEMEIIKVMGTFAFSDIKLSQFYGIEIDDFAHEIAKLSLYLAEHQMNVWTKGQSEYVQVRDPLPLRETGNIVCANATRKDWEEVCPKDLFSEIYLMGNPPYLGYSMQDKEQKADLADVCKGFKNYKNLDYIACWFILGAKFIEKVNAKLAFVSTNSICQGEQVALLWPHILNEGLEIGFAHTSFKWVNNAKANAGVTVSIIGLRNSSKDMKYVFQEGQSKEVKNINAYLANGDNFFIEKRSSPLSKISNILRGSGPVDGGNLIFSTTGKNQFVEKYPDSSGFFKKLIGSAEFIRGQERWCLWIEDDEKDIAEKIEGINIRLKKVQKIREESKKKATKEAAIHPYKFGEPRFKNTNSIIIPRVSSERREYIPCGFLDRETVVLDSAQAIYDAEPWIFGIISSRMHMTWVRAVAGRLKTDYRYSSALCYNTFPIPTLTTKQKEDITRHVYEVLDAREMHPEKAMAQLYDPDKMPDDLREAHHQLDLAVERIYRSKPFSSDEERLEYLFILYERMITEGKADLFSKKKK